MTVVTYNVVIHASIDIDAEDLIEESAREIIENCVEDICTASIHDIDISVE